MRPSSRKSGRRLGVECLENRRLMAGMPELVRDIQTGANDSIELLVSDTNRRFVQVGPTTFFAANNGASGFELYKTNGTLAGTLLVKDIMPGATSSFPNDLTNVNGTLFFTAGIGSTGRELWKSDGTAAGTVLVKDVLPGSGNSLISYLTNANGTLFFSANDGVTGNELWKSNGTAIGTERVKDIRPGSVGSQLRRLTDVNGTLFFQANDGSSAAELWKSDGTAAGTVLVKDIAPGSGGSSPSNLTNVNGTLFFSANDGTTGHELWKSNGSTVGTVRVKDINTSAGEYNSAWPNYLTNANGTLYFNASDGVNAQGLWKSDGTPAGTTQVNDASNGMRDPRFITNVNGKLFFRASNLATGSELWTSDGTSAGTVLVKDIRPGSGNSSPVTTSNTLTNVDGTLFFTANDGTTGTELWRSNGTAAGTVLVKDIRPGNGNSTPNSLTNINGTLFFSATDGVLGRELWSLRPDTLAIVSTSASKNEGNSGRTAFTFTVTRSGALAGTSTVNYAVSGVGVNPASANDFIGNVLPSGQVTFASGQATRVITILVRGDSIAEANERFLVTLSEPSGATIATAAADGLIRNDDTSLAIAATSENKFEGNLGFTSFTFTVTRSGVLTGTTTVNYAVAGNGGKPAQANDFFRNVFPSGTVTFGPRETTKVISILVRADTTAEPDEGFRVTLSGASLGATITTAIATGLIRNDDT